MPRLLLGALALFLAVPAQAQWVEGLTPSPLHAEARPADGVQVHGRWTITVTDPDGSVAERREFQNALTLGGINWFARLLTEGGYTVGDAPLWRVLLTGLDGGAFEYLPAEVSTFDYRVVVGDQEGTVTGIRLDALYQFDNDFSFYNVSTEIEEFNYRSPPNPGDETDFAQFTKKVLEDNIDIVSGQTVSIRVEITFS